MLSDVALCGEELEGAECLLPLGHSGLHGSIIDTPKHKDVTVAWADDVTLYDDWIVTEIGRA